jgi:hypothetical protein
LILVPVFSNQEKYGNNKRAYFLKDRAVYVSLLKGKAHSREAKKGGIHG